MAPEAWHEYKLGEITENFDHMRIPVKKVDRKPGPFPYYGASGVVDFVEDYIFDGEYLLFAEDGENLTSRKLPVAFLASGKFWVNNHAHILRGNDLADTHFLFYYFQGFDISPFLTGSTRPKLTQGHLKQMSVLMPPLSEQRAIADILDSLDDKIELNRRMNQTLESLTRAIFKSWFVDFDPVRAKMEGRQPLGMDAETAPLFPDSFDNSPMGKIPSGWRAADLDQAIEINPARHLRKGEVSPYLEMKNMPTNGHRPVAYEGRAFTSGTRFINGDTLVARITPCLENGKTAYVDFLQDGQTGWGSTEYIVLRPKPPLSVEYGYFLARSEDFRVHAVQSMTGTSGRQRVQTSSLGMFPVAVPPQEISDAFSRLVKPVMQLIHANDIQAGTLAETRDALLPKLVSGEIRVKDAEKFVEGLDELP